MSDTNGTGDRGGTAGGDDTGSDAVSAAGLGVGALVALGTLVPVRRGVDEPAILVAAGFAVATVLAFLLARHGLADRREAGRLAAVASVGVVLLSGYAINQGVSTAVALPTLDSVPVVELGWSIPVVLLAFFAAVATTGLGVATAVGISTAGVVERTLQTATLTVVGFLGLVGAEVATLFVAIPSMLIVGEPTMPQLITMSQLGMAVGTAAVAVGYLALSGRGLEFIDLRLPSKMDLAWTVGGVLVLFGAVVVISVLMTTAGVESADHGTTEQAQENPDVLLVLIPAALLVIGPFEELLYRNVIQKAMYASFSRAGAIVASSVIFAAVHVLAYATAGAGAVIASLGVVFGLSIVLGIIYERTGNLVVPAVVHGVYNAILFANLYFTYG